MKTSRFALVVLALVYLFLLGPFLIIFIASFGADSTLAFPPRGGFSLVWFEKVFTVRMFRDAFWTSLQVAVAATVTALIRAGARWTRAVPVTRTCVEVKNALMSSNSGSKILASCTSRPNSSASGFFVAI